MKFTRSTGVTLVELMIAMTIGLLILAGIARMFATANVGYAALADTAQAGESGRFALDIIGNALRQSAYVDWSANVPADDAAPRLAGLDAKSISKAGEGMTAPLAAAVNGSDVLSLRFAGAGKAPRGDGSMFNCGGFGVPAQQEGWSIFYVARGTDGTGELRCKYRSGGGWSVDALIDGVDGFQVLYGLDTDEPRDGVPNRYVNATTIDALDSSLVLAGATEGERLRERNRRSYWKRVVSVQVALLLRGARSETTAARTYELFGPAYAAAAGATDLGVRLTESQLAGKAQQRQRHLVTATFALRGGAR